MNRRGLLLVLLVLMQISLTGCWSRRELNDLSIAVGLAIDKIDDQYQVSVQVVEPGQVTGKKGSSMAPVTMYQATGDTVLEALRRMTTISPRRMYLAHLRIVVLGETLAEEGIRDAIDFISREPETRNDFFIVVAKGTKAGDTLKILTNIETVPAIRLYSTLKTAGKKWAPTTTVTLSTLISDLVSEGKHPVLTGLEIEGDVNVGQTPKNTETVKSPTELKYSGLAVFDKDKLIGWLNEDEGKAYNYINNTIEGTVGNVACPEGGIITLKVIRSTTRVKGSVVNEIPRIAIEVKVDSNISEVQCHLDLSKIETITEFEKLANRKLEELVESTVKRVQEDYKVDIFGFGEVIHRSNPKAWKKLSKNWDQTFTNIPVEVKFNNKLHQSGKVLNSFLEEMK